MRLDFVSNLDGSYKPNSRFMRPAIDIVFVLDISGSMSCTFPDDVDRRSKLAVAKDCITKISEQLTSTDRAAIVVFNTDSKVVLDLHLMTPSFSRKLLKSLTQINSGGGTNLARGLEAGFAVLRACPRGDGEEPRLQRAYFLTDMESHKADEDAVLAIARAQALCAPARAEPPPASTPRKRRHSSPASAPEKKRGRSGSSTRGR